MTTPIDRTNLDRKYTYISYPCAWAYKNNVLHDECQHACMHACMCIIYMSDIPIYCIYFPVRYYFTYKHAVIQKLLSLHAHDVYIVYLA